jgi:hypothetical protein
MISGGVVSVNRPSSERLKYPELSFYSNISKLYVCLHSYPSGSEAAESSGGPLKN